MSVNGIRRAESCELLHMLAGIIIAAQCGAQLNNWKQEQIGLLINGLPGLKLAPVAQSKMQRALPTDTEPKANSDLGDTGAFPYNR